MAVWGKDELRRGGAGEGREREHGYELKKYKNYLKYTLDINAP